MPQDQGLWDSPQGDHLSCGLHVQTATSERLKLRATCRCFHKLPDLRLLLVCHCFKNHKDVFCAANAKLRLAPAVKQAIQSLTRERGNHKPCN